MKKFKVSVRTEAGTVEEREISARSVEEATELARLQGGLPEEVTEVAEGLQAAWMRGGASVPLDELYHFTKLFATLTKAGVPILETVSLLHQRTAHAGMKRVLQEIVTDIQGGNGIAASFQAHPRAFDATYLHLLRVGEEAGELYRVLSRLAAMLDKRIKLQRLVRKALTYPTLVLTLSGLVTYGILTFIVPRFKDIYKRFGSDLPIPTQITIGASDFLVDHAFASLAGIIGGLAVLWAVGRTAPGRRFFDWLAMSLPVMGPMFHTFEIANFAKSFSILIHSGITVNSSLEILEPAVNRVQVREAVFAAAESIRGGIPMGESFARQDPWLPDILNKMVAVGEKTGNLPEMLDHVADYYEEEFYNRVETLASLIEPVMIVFLGVIIGGIVISLYLPIFGMAKLIARR